MGLFPLGGQQPIRFSLTSFPQLMLAALCFVFILPQSSDSLQSRPSYYTRSLSGIVFLLFCLWWTPAFKLHGSLNTKCGSPRSMRSRLSARRSLVRGQGDRGSRVKDSGLEGLTCRVVREQEGSDLSPRRRGPVSLAGKGRELRYHFTQTRDEKGISGMERRPAICPQVDRRRRRLSEGQKGPSGKCFCHRIKRPSALTQ